MNASTSFDTGSAVSEALRETMMVVNLTISAWGTMRSDRELSGDVAEARSAETRAFKVKKGLFTGADKPFKDIQHITTEFRNYYYGITLPFGSSAGQRMTGPRLLPNRKFLEFIARAGQAKENLKAALAEAKATYHERVEIARVSLGSSFKASDYPDPDDLDRLFSISVDLSPVPDGKGFRNLDESTLEMLDGYMEKKVSDRAATATTHLAERVAAYLKRLKDRLEALKASQTDPDARKASVFNSLFTAAAEVGDMIDAFGAVATPEMLEARTLLREVAQHDAKSIEGSADALLASTLSVYECFQL